MSKTANYSGQNQSFDQSQFPIVCQTCLGDNAFMRMMVDRYGQACKICDKPFTTYRWSAGPKMRYKKTEICQICSRAKNVCQTCLLDLTYNLPVQVRDRLLQISSDMPKSGVNLAYHRQNLEKQLEDKPIAPCPELLALPPPLNPALAGPSKEPGKVMPPGALTLQKLARRAPFYKRNLPHICSFWVKGECRRGDECPYRHEKPSDPDDPLSRQNIKDRYHGTRDPVAQRLLAKAAEEAKQEKLAKEPTEFTE